MLDFLMFFIALAVVISLIYGVVSHIKVKHKFDNYITKEAEMLIAEYISRMERNNKKEKLEAIKSKYELSKKINICLSIILFISLILNLI